MKKLLQKLHYLSFLKNEIGSILTALALLFIFVVRSEYGTNIFNDGTWFIVYLLFPIIMLSLIYFFNRGKYNYTIYLVGLFVYEFILYLTSGYFRAKSIDVSSISIVVYMIGLLFFQGGLFEQKHHREITIFSKKGMFYTIVPIVLLWGVYLLNEFIVEYIK